MKFNTIQIISIFAVFQSVFLGSYFLVLKKGDRQINFILSLFLFCFAVLVFISLSLTEGLELILIKYHKPIFLIRQIAFLIGPLLFWFVQRSLDLNYKLDIQSTWHLLPFIISIVYNGILIAPLPEFIFWLSDLRLINTVLILIHLLIYIIVSISFIKKTKMFLNFTLKGSRKAILSLMSLLICGTVIIWIVELNSLVILSIFEYFQFCPNMAGLYSASTFIFFNSIAFFVLQKPELFTSNRKYEKSRLKTAEKKIYQKKLIEYMKKYKPYRNSSLTLTDLSKQLSITMCYVSQVINESYNQNYSDFINSYRIKESCNLLLDESNGNMTVLEIAYNVGFNSKSAFNTAFKKFVGITPTEYRRNNSN